MKLKVFIGPKGSGKDTVAKLYPGLKGKIPFAGPLKEICSDVFGIPMHEWEDQDLKEEFFEVQINPGDIEAIVGLMDNYIHIPGGCLPDVCDMMYDHEGKVLRSRREILQYVGTEMIRSVSPDWHCRAAFSDAYLKDKFSHVDIRDGVFAVTDCRFLNELEYLKANHTCEFFYVVRPEAEERLAAATHQSETEIIEVFRAANPTVIENHGTLEDLKAEVAKL